MLASKLLIGCAGKANKLITNGTMKYEIANKPAIQQASKTVLGRLERQEVKVVII